MTSAVPLDTHVREIVADTLGVDPSAIAHDVSLTDDLAADSLDLVELSVAIERAIGVVLPRRVLDDVRTFGDLVDAILGASRLRRGGAAAAVPPFLRARITGPGGSGWVLERALPLTPYALESIAEDTLGTGPGTRLEVTIADWSEAALADVQRTLAPLARRGVQVRVRRDPAYRRLAEARTG